MIDRQEIHEVAGAVSLGLLSEDVVLSAGRVLRKEALEPSDYEALRNGKALLERLGSKAIGGAVVPPGPRRIDSDESDLDVYRAVRIQSPNEPARDLLSRLADLLDRAIGGRLSSDDDTGILFTRELFTRVGQLTLARTDDLFDRARTEQLEWMDPGRSLRS
jgi:hypothetical protein